MRLTDPRDSAWTRALLVIAPLLLGACERASGQYDYVDSPEPAPVGEEIDPQALVDAVKNSQEPTSADGWCATRPTCSSPRPSRST